MGLSKSFVFSGESSAKSFVGDIASSDIDETESDGSMVPQSYSNFCLFWSFSSKFNAEKSQALDKSKFLNGKNAVYVHYVRRLQYVECIFSIRINHTVYS